MDNYDVAHNFFYDLSGCFSKHYMNVSYNNYKFYSYYTCIGKVIEDLSGRNLLLVSEDNFSKSTAKHINNLLGACPFYGRLFVPVKYGDNDIEINKLEEKICRKLDIYKNSKLSLKENRDKYCHYYTMLCEVAHKIVKIKKSTIAKYRGLYLDLQDINKVNALKQKQRIKDKKAIEKAKKEKEKALKQLKTECSLIELNNIVDYAKFVFSKNFTNENIEQLKNTAEYGKQKIWEIKDKVSDFLYYTYKNIDFVWIEGENFKTSKNITLPVEFCRAAIELYKKNKIKNGLKLDRYTILEHNLNYIKIGCHKISRENIDLLIKEIEG